MGELIDLKSEQKQQHGLPGAQPVTKELARILALVRQGCPSNSLITFDFDGRLRVHIDVHNAEAVSVIEAILPTLDPGLFHAVSRGATPHHPFFHRVSALVNA